MPVMSQRAYPLHRGFSTPTVDTWERVVDNDRNEARIVPPPFLATLIDAPVKWINEMDGLSIRRGRLLTALPGAA